MTWSWGAAALALPELGRLPRLGHRRPRGDDRPGGGGGLAAPGGRPSPDAVMPRFYARALRALARQGLAPTPGETAREFAGRANKRFRHPNQRG